MIDLKNTFNAFSDIKVIIIGDVMVDTYINGTVSRISPEAPVPVVKFSSREHRLGGAANVALNIKALGATPFICSIIGKDEDADLFMKLVNESKLSDRGIIGFDDRVTSVKTRVIGNNQQLIRVDREEVKPLSSSAEYALVEKVKSIAEKEKIDAIIFQDYNKGVITPGMIKSIVDFANKNQIITTVDPKKENFFAYKNVTLFKPNLKELTEGTDVKIDIDDKESFLSAVEKLDEKISARHIFVTLSEHGVFINEDEKNHFIPAHFRVIADVSGAGDTVISVATLCLACDVPPKLIAEIANLAGGLVCEKVGVVSIDKEQLMNEALSL